MPGSRVRARGFTAARPRSLRAVGPRLWAAGSAAVAALTTGIYLAGIAQEGNNAFWDVFPWAMLMAIGTVAAALPALLADVRLARYGAVAAVVILGTLGVVAIFSVGAGFLLAAVLAVVAAVSRRSEPSVPV